MNKNILKAGAAIVVAGSMFTSAANSAGLESVTTDASVTIVAPLTVAAGDQLSFGKIVKPTSAATAIVAVGGSAITGTAVSTGGTIQDGTVDISGTAGETVDITIADAADATDSVLGLSSFTYGAFGDASAGSGGTISGVELASGTNALAIGATLTIQPGIAAGSEYNPEYTVTVEYN